MISVGDLRPGITFEYEGNLYVVSIKIKCNTFIILEKH